MRMHAHMRRQFYTQRSSLRVLSLIVDSPLCLPCHAMFRLCPMCASAGDAAQQGHRSGPQVGYGREEEPACAQDHLPREGPFGRGCRCEMRGWLCCVLTMPTWVVRRLAHYTGSVHGAVVRCEARGERTHFCCHACAGESCAEDEDALAEVKVLLDSMVDYVCDEHARWLAACDEAFKFLSYAAEDYNRIAVKVRELDPGMQGLALSGAYSSWRARVKDLVALSPYHPLLFEGKQSKRGMCQLWSAEQCRCAGICEDCGKPRHGSFPFSVLYALGYSEMCDCYPVLGVSECGMFQHLRRGLRGWRPASALPLARRLELSKRDLEARALFEDIGDAVSALVRSNGKTRVVPAPAMSRHVRRLHAAAAEKN